jgi:hypothetical protein
MEILKDFDLSLTVDDVLRGEGADPEVVRIKRPALVKTAMIALERGSAKLHPVAKLRRMKVSEHRHEFILLQGGIKIANPMVARHLAGAEDIVLAICTIGLELENYSSSLIKDEPLLALAIDGLGNAAIERISQDICGQLGDEVKEKGLNTSVPISPGLPEWPVEAGQPQIFTLLDPSQIGITLSSGGMMIPKKSISFMLGIGHGMAQTDLCELCSLRERCYYRHK